MHTSQSVLFLGWPERAFVSQDVPRSTKTTAFHVRQVSGHTISDVWESEEWFLCLWHWIEQMDADLRGYRNYGRAAACVRSSDVDGCRETHHLRIRRTSTGSSDKVSYVEKNGFTRILFIYEFVLMLFLWSLSSADEHGLIPEPHFSGLYSYHVPTGTWTRLACDIADKSCSKDMPIYRSRAGHSMLFHPVSILIFDWDKYNSKKKSENARFRQGINNAYL